ncbi:hypothetical protein ABZ946_33080 [Streptomyces sp. NPDC046324]|uniref:hypothetical protein n=1 Tax=Streptomyces sp. NPDC046324 TaxID=3154915 RepID=UPI0033FD0BA3
MWAWSSPYSGGWELDWARTEGGPTKETVRAELAADPVVGSYADEITLCPTWGRITRRARELLEPGAAVVHRYPGRSLSHQQICSPRTLSEEVHSVE